MDIKTATMKLKQIYSNMNAIASFASQFNNEVNTLSQVRVRLEELPGYSERFEEYHAIVQSLDSQSDELRMKEQSAFREMFFDVKSSLLHILETEESKKSDITSPSYSSVGNRVNTNAMKLPPIATPKFSGDWQQWTSFIDSFNAMFHNNQSLAPVQRFHYLKSCLEGQAIDVIKSIPTTNENYQQAYDALTSRYENKGAIIQSHIRALFDTPKVLTASATELQALHHHVTSNINALQSLAQPIESWDAWLVTLICNRMDSATVGEWHLQYKKKDLPKYEEIKTFLFNRIAAYEAGEVNVGATCIKKPIVKSSFKSQEKRIFFTKPAYKSTIVHKCPFCSETHKLYSCKGFNDLSVADRREFVLKGRLCFNCFCSNHQARSCKFPSCPKCGQRHNSKLHLEQSLENDEPISETEPVENLSSALCAIKGVAQVMQASGGMVMLATAIVYIKNEAGNFQACRALLDSGSQVNFITDACAQRLGLSKTKCYVPIVGINSMRSNAQRLQPVVMCSRFEQYSTTLELHLLPSISNDMPSQLIHVDQSKIPECVNKQLADPTYDTPGRIDILIGAETFYILFSGERVEISKGLMFHNTKLGWILTGKVMGNDIKHSKLSNCNCTQDKATNSALSLFVRTSNTRTIEENETEQHFKDTHFRNESGRFVVRLPLNTQLNALGESSYMAQQRFYNVEKRLCKDKKLSVAYHKFMSEYIDMNHMELITNSKSDIQTYYLPHHAVIKEDSITTKLRVVFDASAPTSSGLSLNDILKRGPIVQSSLFSILLRFRLHKIALTADVEKMYRQILVASEDRDLQRIWYRTSPAESLKEYNLRTVTYGTQSAPYLSTRCLVELASTAPNENVQRVIRDDFYVDDLLTGAESTEECFQLFKDVTDTLNSGCMPLRKWCTSSTETLNKLPSVGNDPNHVLQLGENDAVSTLGIMWQPNTDCFRFRLKPWSLPKIMTKRTLLSDINRVYDPIGFITPILISGKIFIQQLWTLKIDWDTVLPNEMQQRWETFYLSLNALDKLVIPRRALLSNWSSIQLHGFCDASQEAYGACIYTVTQGDNSEIQTSLYVSKSRVAPIHPTTIPRLELCGAVLLSELITEAMYEFKKLNINVNKDDVVLWSDSTIVIAWINSTQPLTSFVSNRVAQILDNTDRLQWRHVPTESNPADLITRGRTVNNLLQCTLWWNGPRWLSENHTSWPMSKQSLLNENIPEVRCIKLSLVAGCVSNILLDRYSEWTRLIRITAWLRRFINNAKATLAPKVYGPLTVLELTKAQTVWLQYGQSIEFKEELTALRKEKLVSSKSRLKSLNPFIDQDGLVRVGGRLALSNLSDQQRFPIVLPPRHKITKMIFEHEHKRLLHAGPQALLASVHTHYWPLRGRDIARLTVHKCITCFRHHPITLTPFMAPLPRQRTSIERPFTHTGVDFCGPVSVRSGIRRVTSTKAYISVFVCFSTRAIHLELVNGMTSNAFVAALKRFVGRRGSPQHMYSDNGTNFVGADKELRSYIRQLHEDYRLDKSITLPGMQWHFNSPASPHFGGLWESAVKSTKTHLMKCTKGALFTFEELSTLLCQVEAVLNSRPMTPLSTDPSDFTALTPAHFLIGSPLTHVLEPTMATEPRSKLKRWELVRFQAQHFWKRWSKEYLPQLQRRGRWLTLSRPVEVGDLAILKEDNQPVRQWKLVRITAVHPGPDGITRVVTIRNSAGKEYQRPVVKLSVLPTSLDEDIIIPVAEN